MQKAMQAIQLAEGLQINLNAEEVESLLNVIMEINEDLKHRPVGVATELDLIRRYK